MREDRATLTPNLPAVVVVVVVAVAVAVAVGTTTKNNVASLWRPL
jgi:hypothetical protein